MPIFPVPNWCLVSTRMPFQTRTNKRKISAEIRPQSVSGQSQRLQTWIPIQHNIFSISFNCYGQERRQTKTNNPRLRQHTLVVRSPHNVQQIKWNAMRHKRLFICNLFCGSERRHKQENRLETNPNWTCAFHKYLTDKIMQKTCK
jgi:hypothetical protein